MKPFLTKAPPPIRPVRGGSRVQPEPTRIPSELLTGYARALVGPTHRIIVEAVRKFPVQTRTLERCEYVIAALTPHFHEALRNKVFAPDRAFYMMGDLVDCLLIWNCGGWSRSEIKQEVLKSDEYLTFAALPTEIDNDAPITSRSARGGKNSEDDARLGATFAQYDEELKRLSKAARREPRYDEKTARKEFPEFTLWPALDNLSASLREDFFHKRGFQSTEGRFTLIGQLTSPTMGWATAYDYFKRRPKDKTTPA